MRFGIAVIGQGFMGRAHSLGWSRVAAVGKGPLEPVLTILAGRDGEALERNARRYGFEDWTSDWARALERQDVDLVDICTPGALHAEMALAALAAGKHVLCEKPLANSLEEARSLARAAEAAAQSGVYACVGFNYRRVPALAVAQRLVSEGHLGQLRHVRTCYLQDWLVDPDFPLSWRLDASEAGSGALGDLLSHVVDLVRFLSGEELEEVSATLKTFVAERPLASRQAGLSAVSTVSGRKGRVTVDDACAVVGRLGNGALVTMEATRVAPGRKNALQIELYGSTGSLSFDLERLNELQVYENSAAYQGFSRVLVTNSDDPYIDQWWPPGHVLGWEHTFVHEFEEMLRAIADKREPEPSFADGLATQVVLDAIIRSSRERAWTEVNSSTS